MPHDTCLLTPGMVYTTYPINCVVIVTACSITSILQSEKGLALAVWHGRSPKAEMGSIRAVVHRAAHQVLTVAGREGVLCLVQQLQQGHARTPVMCIICIAQLIWNRLPKHQSPGIDCLLHTDQLEQTASTAFACSRVRPERTGNG